MPYVFLAIAILSETLGTSLLKLSDGFSRLWPSLGVLVAYGVSFYCLSQVLRDIPTGIAYAIWSGVGIVLIATIGWVFFKQTLDLPAVIGLGLIVAGVLVINLFSTSLGH
jgi:small multidrug resistance pump